MFKNEIQKLPRFRALDKKVDSGILMSSEHIPISVPLDHHRQRCLAVTSDKLGSTAVASACLLPLPRCRLSAVAFDFRFSPRRPITLPYLIEQIKRTLFRVLQKLYSRELAGIRQTRG